MWKRRHLPTLFGLAIVLLLAWFRAADPYPVQALRDIAFDNFQRIAPRAAGDFPVRIVDIDEASLAEIGQWPWPRDTMARLATQLTAMGAAAVVFDVLFPEPDRMSPIRLAEKLKGAQATSAGLDNAPPLEDYDQTLATALENSPSVLGFGVTPATGPLPARSKSGIAVVGDDPAAAVPLMPGTASSLPILVNAAKGLGSISLEPAGSVSAVRRLPLLWSDGKQLFPSLSIEALRVAMGVETIVVFSDQTGHGAVQSVRVGNYEVPVMPDGTMWLYYQPALPDLYVPAKDILGPDSAQKTNLIAGNIVFIGTSATGLLDIRGTPLGTNLPGVEIHAQAIQQIISGTYLNRTDWVSGLELLAFVFIGMIIVVVILRSGPLVCLVVGGVLGVAVVGASWLAFTRAGLLIDPSFPLLGSFIVYSAMIFFQFTITDADKRLIRRAFGQYVAPALLEKIEKSGEKLKLGGEMRELTVMFLDIRSFTTLSEGFEPPRLVMLLNTLFGALGAQITEQFGTIDKFIGDAIMAFWNAPIDVENHATRACIAALGMRKTLAELNATDAFHLKAENRAMKEIAIGIGISTGEALVGNLGLETRFDYSCIGDTVNVASRVEDACKVVGYDIVVVETTHAAAPDLAFLEAGSIALKGKSAREPIYILVGDAEMAASPAFHTLREAHLAAVRDLSEGRDADKAIDRCLELVPSSDQFLAKFYHALRGRRADYHFEQAAPARIATA